MTGNQIKYWEHKETQRHNQVTEKETNRHNVATETETNRHNVVTEGIDLGRLNETIRHNTVTESQGWATIDETKRHNLATEGISSQQNQLGYDRLTEDSRHNRVTEQAGLVDLNIKQQNASETNRHNLEVEALNRAIEESQASLRKVQQEYQEMAKTWDGLEKSAHVELTRAQRDEYKMRTQQLQASIRQLEQAIKFGNAEEIRKWQDTMNNQAQTAVKLIDSLIPG